MKIYKKINSIIKNKNISKRTFSNKLRSLEVPLESTGAIPSEQTIYKYLSGYISIPIELLSKIADVLDITEQELFDSNNTNKMQLSKRQLNYRHRLNNNGQLNKYIDFVFKDYEEKLPFQNTQNIEKLISLLKFAPNHMVLNIVSRLEQIKTISLRNI